MKGLATLLLGGLLLIAPSTHAGVGASGITGGDTPLAVLIVTLDDYGTDVGDNYGATGTFAIPLPNFDRLNDDGARFTQFYVNPACATTRASLWSGQHNFRTNVYGAIAGGLWDSDADHVIGLRVLALGGQAWQYGKFGLGDGDYGNWAAAAAGFDAWHWAGVTLDGTGYRNWKLETQDQAGFIAAGPSYATDPPSFSGQSEYVDDAMVDRIVADLNGRDRTIPYVAGFGIANIHTPLHDPAMAAPANSCDAPLSNDDCKLLMIEKADETIGRLIDELDWGRLVMFVFGDNGTGGTGKGTSYESGIRVPAYVYGAGVPAGGTITDATGLVDVHMTTLDLLGDTAYAGTATLDGYSMATLIGHPCERTDSRCWGDRTGVVYSAQGDPPTWRAYRETLGTYPDYKLRYDGTTGDAELYDLSSYAGWGQETGDLCGGDGDCSNLTGTDLLAFDSLCSGLNALEPGMTVPACGGGEFFAATEQRCQDLDILAGYDCIGSEPFNGSMIDDTSQGGLNVDEGNPCVFVDASDNGFPTMVAPEQVCSWTMPDNGDLISATVDFTDGTLCARGYISFSSGFQTGGSGGTDPNVKLMRFQDPKCTGGSCLDDCVTNGNCQPGTETEWIEAGRWRVSDHGNGMFNPDTIGAHYPESGDSVDMFDCRDHSCRYEMCLDHNKNGDDKLWGRGYLVNMDNGDRRDYGPIEYPTPQALAWSGSNFKPFQMFAQSNSGNVLYGSFVMTAVKLAVDDTFWIGPACAELSGQDGDPDCP